MNQDQLIQIQNAYLKKRYPKGYAGLMQAPTLEDIEVILECAERVKEREL